MMKTKTFVTQRWTCPRCGRQFQKRGQSHSCKSFELSEHFRNNPAGKSLYAGLKNAVKKKVGPFRIESLECCIHLVSTFTFAAVKIFKNKIQVDFALNRKIKSKRISRTAQMSTRRWLYVVNICDEDEIDKELLEWIREAYTKKESLVPV